MCLSYSYLSPALFLSLSLFLYVSLPLSPTYSLRQGERKAIGVGRREKEDGGKRL